MQTTMLLTAAPTTELVRSPWVIGTGGVGDSVQEELKD
jgi:hypothetical protein